MKFHRPFHSHHTIHNIEIINEIVQKGKELNNSGNLVDAESHFSRALFLARINYVDTSEIYQLAADTKSRLTEITNKKQFQQYYDSANEDDN